MLKIALPNDIRSLDPAYSFEKNSSHVINMVFEGLMRRGVDDIPQLAIAEVVDISRDQVHYVFHLRDCSWSDGVPITAYDFEFSWKRSLDPNSKPITEVATEIPRCFSISRKSEAAVLVILLLFTAPAI